MGVQIKVEGQPITLDELRQFVEHTSTWPGDSVVEPRGSQTGQASITIEHRTPAQRHAEQVKTLDRAVSDGD